MKLRKMELLVLLLAASLIAGTANADITEGLTGYWPFEEDAGTTTADMSLNGNDGTFVGTPIWDSGPEGFGGGLFFDKDDDNYTHDGVYCGTFNPSEGSDDGEFTLALWAYWQKNEPVGRFWSMFMSKADLDKSNSEDDIMFGWVMWNGHSDPEFNDKIGIYNYGPTPSTIILSSETMPDQEWVHLAVTYDGDNVQLYINGITDDLGAQVWAPGPNTGAQFHIGRNTQNCYTGRRCSFDGYLDEARTYNRVLSQADIQELLATDWAVNIEPRNGEPLAALDTDLVWDKPTAFTPSKYDLRCAAEEPNFATGTVIEELGIIHTDPCNVYTPSAPFAYNTTYYWRVDSYHLGASDPCEGKIWSFTTMPEWPVITEDPCSLTVAAGDTAVFRVKDVNGVSYIWKNQSGDTVGSGPVLTLTNVQKDPCEDSYRCIVSKSGFDDAESAWAGLWTKRLIAHWDFEGNLNDSGGVWPGDYVDPNELHPDPTVVYGSGLDGGLALQLAADPCHVQITDSEDFFNFYPLGYSANVWFKTVQSGWGALACKQLADTLGWTVYYGEGGIWNGLRGVGSVASSGSLNDDQWHMVTATYNAETGVITTYVDGEPVGSDTSSDVALTNIYPVILGAEHIDGVANRYEGLLDSVGIYSYAISPLEVAVLYTDVMTDVEICVGGNPENDLSGNCRVDIEDFAILATSWLECNLVPDCMP